MRMKTKENGQRQREKAWDGCMDPDKKASGALGMESLSDSELVALVIRSGTKDKTALQLASELLSVGGGQLLNLHSLGVAEMMKLDGIGKVKALQLKAVAELAKRLTLADRKQQIVLDTPRTIANYYMERMRHEPQELLFVALFDTQGHFMEDALVSKGTLTYAVFSPREIFSYAVRKLACFVVILHNHPSGSPEPSEEDNSATKRIAACGKLLEIPLLDHIIIGDNVYYSYREQRLLE